MTLRLVSNAFDVKSGRPFVGIKISPTACDWRNCLNAQSEGQEKGQEH